jgi:hypothetical protein
MSGPVVATRANARVSRAEKAALSAFVTGSLVTYQHMSLWLWVGGTATLGQATLEFRPNSLNLAFEQGDGGPLSDAQPFTIEVPLAAVRDVEVTSGPFTRIHVRTDRGTLSLRCSGARAFAGAIRERAAAGGGFRSPT